MAQTPPIGVYNDLASGYATLDIAVETIPANLEFTLPTSNIQIGPRNMVLSADDSYFLRVVLNGALWRVGAGSNVSRISGGAPN